MIASFRKAIKEALPSEEKLQDTLQQQSAQDWQAISDVFAVGLPEFDGILALPSSAILAEQVANARGVPFVVAQYSNEDHTWVLPQLGRLASSESEFIVLTDYLQDGFNEVELLENALQDGVKVRWVGAAVERSNLGARNRLVALGAEVRAVFQIADTPQGLVFERRSPNRWVPNSDEGDSGPKISH